MASFSCPHSVLQLARTATAWMAATRAAIWVGSRPGTSCATTRPSVVAAMLPRTPGTLILISRNSSAIRSVTTSSSRIAAFPAGYGAYERHDHGLTADGGRRAPRYGQQPELDQPVHLDRGAEDAPAQVHGEAARRRPAVGSDEQCPLGRRNLRGRQAERRLAADRRVRGDDRR